MLKNQIQQTRDASIPYTLYLDKETYTLNPAEFLDPSAKKKRHTLCYIYHVQSFTNQTLIINSNHEEGTLTQTFTINEDNLRITCDCGFQVKDLCIHVIEVLIRIIHNKGADYFRQFKHFPYNCTPEQAAYFDFKCDYHGVKVSSKPGYGLIYHKHSPETIQTLVPSSNLQNALPQITEADTVTGYALAGVSHGPGIPFLVPYQAILKKEKNEIKSFIAFTPQTTTPSGLTADQRLIHSYCEDFNKLLTLDHTFTTRTGDNYHSPIEIQQRHTAFNYWKQLVPILKLQPYIHFYWFYKNVDFSTRPKRLRMHKISLSDTPVTFKLILTEHPGHYSLSCKATLNGKEEEIEGLRPNSIPFFFTLKRDSAMYYQFSSLQEAEVIKGFERSKFKLTIFKKDFADFNNKILSTLALNFPITYQLDADLKTRELKIITKQVHVEEKNGIVSFTPQIQYDNDRAVSPFSKGTTILDNQDKNYRILKRNKQEEDTFKQTFISLHPSFEQQAHQQTFYLSRSILLQANWLSSAIFSLSKIKTSFTGLEKLYWLNDLFTPPTIDIHVNAAQDWFDITVDVAFGDITLSPVEIKKALKSKSTDVKLSNGSIGHLPNAFFTQLTSVFGNGELTSKGVKISNIHYTLIDQLHDKKVQPEIIEQLANRDNIFKQIEKTPLIKVPEHIKASIRPYQMIGFSWMCHLHTLKWGGLLADDMGLGKTLQVLMLLQHLKNEELAKAPHLLIAPTSLLFNWNEEAEKFCPQLKILTYHGFEREKDSNELMKYDLIVTSYGVTMIDIEFLSTIPFDYVILDEAQAIKNPISQRFKAANLLQANNRLALTGTPVENSSTDLYALMSFINPGFFGTLKLFKDNLDPNVLARMTHPFILRRTKQQVAPDLPLKTEMVIWCEMGTKQRHIYDQCRKRYKDDLVKKIDSEGFAQSTLYVLDGLMKLRQICNSPALLKKDKPFDNDSCKIDELMLHITEKTANHKILVFSQFTGMLTLIAEQLKLKHINFSYLDGKTPIKHRNKAVDDFQQDENTRVFLISLKAGGTGLNLTAADYVYLVDPWWNPAAEAQAIDRCHRIGQDKPVIAYRMICKDTLEEKILDIQQTKKTLAGKLIPTDDGVLKSLSKEDVLKLFG